ncbi:substrate-binding periplasmic protein [Undibacterium sp. Ji67W]|uniref:substrate-binding periplasmic protein n=1 Tax=Undibacterium sp. Ji67W TaxID=3413042 RepID=UPI003BF380AD
MFVSALFSGVFLLQSGVVVAAIKEPQATADGSSAQEVVVLTNDPVDSKGQSMPMDKIGNLLDYIAMTSNLKIRWVRTPWQRAVKVAEAGGGVIFGMSRVKDREKIYHFSLPVRMQYVFLVTRSDSQFAFNSLADLRGKTIGIPRGFMFNDEFETYRDKVFKVENDGHDRIARLNKLMFRRMDAALFTTSNKNPRFLERSLQNARVDQESTFPQFDTVDIAVLPKPVVIDTIHFAIRADKDDGLIDKINDAILKARKAGILEDIPASFN